MRFEYPLVLIAIPILVGLLYYFTKPRSAVSFCFRVLIIILLAFIVAGFRIKALPQNTCRIYLIDDSASVFLDKEGLLASINDSAKKSGPDDVNRILYLNPTDDKTVTNIEKGLLAARSLFPVGYCKEIFLFTDGNETEGDARNVIPILKQEGITLYTIPVGPKEVVDIKMDNVDAPKFVREGQPIELKCRISSTINTKVGIKIFGNGNLIKEAGGISLLQGQDNIVAVTMPAQSEPALTYGVDVSVQVLNEITVQNNHWQVVVQKVGKLKVLYLPPRVEAPYQRFVPKIIRSNDSFDLNVAASPSVFKLSDIIICDNLSLQSLPEGVISFVANGGGLLVVGGKDSFGLGNYQNSELEKILPVYATPPEDLALVMIQDASGSMDEISEIAGKTKFQVASKALEDSLSLLSKIDMLEVLVFNQGYETILPFQNADSISSKLKEGIAKVKPTGPTAILPPLQKAIDTLRHVSSAKKHIILLSDGHSTTNEPVDGFNQVADKLRQSNITISVIATGERINEETLKALTNDGKTGKIYRLSGKDKDSLAGNLKDDLSVSKEFSRQAENIPVNIHFRDDALKGIDNIPPISGYNRTTLKPNARLVASVGDKEPLLADWQYGLGRVMVLTGSLDSQWTGGWRKWDGLGQLVIQALRYLTADMGNNQLADIITEEMADGRIKLSVGAPGNLELDAHVEPLYGEGAHANHIRLAQVAAGRYEGVLPAQEEVLISIFSRKEGVKQSLGRVPVVRQYSREWRRFTPDTGFLKDIAESTGGKFISADKFTKGDVPVTSANQSGPTYRNINAILILAALGLFLADLLVKR